MNIPNTNQDEVCFEALLNIVKDYVDYAKEQPVNVEVLQALRNHFEEWRLQIKDVARQQYLTFEFMEKLAQQEYLAGFDSNKKHTQSKEEHRG